MKLALVLAILISSAAAAVEASQENHLRSSLIARVLQETNSPTGAPTSHCEDEESQHSSHDNGDHPCHVADTAACFSAFNSVEVQGKGMVSMDAVKVGDYVRSNNNGFSRVFSLAHLDHDAESEFIQIFSEGVEKPLEITENHMLYASAGKHVRAGEVNVGDMLTQGKVSEIKSVKRTGLYAPITQSGDIVVSGVQASSYTAFLDGIPFDQHVLAHFFFAPQRVMCSFDFKLCENEGHTDGYTNWAHWAIKLLEKSNEFVAPVQVVLTLLALPFLSAFYSLEQMLLAPLTSLAVIGYIIYRKNQKASKAWRWRCEMFLIVAKDNFVIEGKNAEEQYYKDIIRSV